MSTSSYRTLFGPVPSRRLGRSLGIDLTPFKTCTLDCVFCQLGRTTVKTIERKEYVSTEEVETELKAWARAGGEADYVTLSGYGEPTLHSEFGEVVRAIHRHAKRPAVLLSNGTLFDQAAVRAAAREADIVKVSVSAWDSVSFGRIHRPHPGVNFDRMLEGYRAFRTEYSGRLWIEVFLVPGLNTDWEDVERISALVANISPEAVHLNTAVRPPAEAGVQPLSRKELDARASCFRPRALVMTEFSSRSAMDLAAHEDAVRALLMRRPCTAQQIADVFDMHVNEVSKYLGKGIRTGVLTGQEREGDMYYSGTKK